MLHSVYFMWKNYHCNSVYSNLSSRCSGISCPVQVCPHVQEYVQVTIAIVCVDDAVARVAVVWRLVAVPWLISQIDFLVLPQKYCCANTLAWPELEMESLSWINNKYLISTLFLYLRIIDKTKERINWTYHILPTLPALPSINLTMSVPKPAAEAPAVLRKILF